MCQLSQATTPWGLPLLPPPLSLPPQPPQEFIIMLIIFIIPRCTWPQIEKNFCTWVITCAHSMPQQNANVLAGISLQNMVINNTIWLHIIFHPRAQAHYRFDTEETTKTQHDPAIKQWLKSTESTARLPFIPPPFPSFPPLPPGRESRGVAKTTVTGVARFCGTLPWMLDVGLSWIQKLDVGISGLLSMTFYDILGTCQHVCECLTKKM